MAQFDAYRNSDDGNGDVPFLLDVQSDLLRDLATRVVVPLVRTSRFTPMSRLNPRFMIGDEEVTMLTPQLAGMSRAEMGERVGSLDHHRSDIIAAIDLLITGV